MADSMHALAGMAGLLALAWAMSENRRAIPWRAVIAGMALLVILTVVFLKIPLVKSLFMQLNDVLLVLERATLAGTSLVFGYLGGGPAPFQVSDVNSNFVLAFRALPIVLVISALSALLFYWRIVPAIVRGLSFVLEKAMRVGGVVGLSTAANVFVGMVEAPLLVRPYLARLSRGELFAIMAGGMASIAGTVLFLYGSILGRVMPDAVAHLLIASILSAPAALVIAFLMVPPGLTAGEALTLKSDAAGSMDALTRGTLEGAQLLLNIVAMLVVFVALVALVNLIIAPYTLQGALGWLLAPLAWLAGIPWHEARTAGALLGTKTVINELVAYLDLANAKDLSERSRMLLTYALCGFANLGSLGIMIGGMGTMAPERRPEIVDLGIKSIIAGTLATCMTSASVALFL
ncbi:MAG TPA: nucleoside transporter C-terminal domain-containing protein [Burkholderiales bacterium]|nr:nucleoside transporter C-terminal domain-containing protein [Burkholderiales bacterium]